MKSIPEKRTETASTSYMNPPSFFLFSLELETVTQRRWVIPISSVCTKHHFAPPVSKLWWLNTHLIIWSSVVSHGFWRPIRPVPNGFGRDSAWCLLISLVMLSFEPLRSLPMLEAVALPNLFGSNGCSGETICWICNRGTYGNYLVNVTRQVIGKEKASSESN
jgi:hypothetical protein